MVSFEQLTRKLPRCTLADGLPTPVEEGAELARHWGLAGLWIKRDDLTSSLYGGNKVRKLEWILGAARAAGRRRVVTAGAWGSHHALATALFARALDLPSTLILVPQPLTPHVRENLAAAAATGADLLFPPSFPVLPAYRAAALGWSIVRGEKPRWIPLGGSEALGVLGYVGCAFELAEQVERGLCPPPDRVVAAAGTCGTIAGLALGLSLAARRLPALRGSRVVAVSVVPPAIAGPRRTRQLIDACRNLLAGADPAVLAVEPQPIEWVTDELGRGYGHPTESARGAEHDVRRLTPLDAETTYTAKALAGLRRDGRRNRAEGRHLTYLYVHTLSRAHPPPPPDTAWIARLPRRLRGLVGER